MAPIACRLATDELRRQGWQDDAEAADARWSAALEWNPDHLLPGTSTYLRHLIDAANHDIRAARVAESEGEGGC